VDATAPIAASKVAVPVVTFIDESVFVVPITELNVTPPEVFETFKTPLSAALPFMTAVTDCAEIRLKLE